MAGLRAPTLLLLGEHTASVHPRLSVKSLAEALPNNPLVELEGQEHNAMHIDRKKLAAVVKAFLQVRP